MTSTASRVRVLESALDVYADERHRQYPVIEMPDEFLTWQLRARLDMHQHFGQGADVTVFPAHLPVAATFDGERAFPVHTAVKATGLMPSEPHLGTYVQQLAECLQSGADLPWDATREARIEAALALYQHPDHIDRRTMGQIEIFQGQTYANLRHNPLMALHYTDAGPTYRSYQLNGVVEMVGHGDPRFEFLYLMRQLFERDTFHVQQPAYPSGYVFWLSEVYDKSPRRRGDRRVR